MDSSAASATYRTTLSSLSNGTTYSSMSRLAEYRPSIAPTVLAPFPQARKDRRSVTLLMTDIVDSTATAASLGDERWADLLELHNDQARAGVERCSGHVVDFAGDRLFAVFEGPRAAIACATGLHGLMRALGLHLRAGVHIGEVEVRDDHVIGLAVHIAARIAACARDGETLVSHAVKDLLEGSGIGLCMRGVYRLKGVPDQWQLFAVQPSMICCD